MGLHLPQHTSKDRLRVAAFCVLWLITPPAQSDTLEQIDIIDASEELNELRTGDVVVQEHSGFSSKISLSDSHTVGGQTLSDIVSQEAGSEVRSSGGLGGYSEISLRGASSEQVMIYLDGLLLNEGSGGGVDLSLINLSQLASIDIYRGSTPIQLGNASFGGAVNLVTPRTGQSQQTGLSTTFGAFGTQKFSGRLSGRKGKLDGLVAIGAARADNDFTFNNDNGTQYNPNDDRREQRNNADVSQTSALLKVGWQKSTNNRADISLQLLQKDQALPSWNNHQNTNTQFDTRSYQLRTKLTSNSHFSDRLNTSLELYLAKKNEIYDDRNNAIGLSAQFDEHHTRTSGIKHYLEWLSDTSTTAATTDIRQEKYHRDDRLDYKIDDNSKRQSLSLGVQHSRFLLQDRLTITPQFRLQRVVNHFDDNESTVKRKSQRYANPGLGVSYTYSDSLTFKSNFGRYIREPAFYELFGDRGLFLGNSELNAETGTNFDMGIIWNSSPSFWNIKSSKVQVSIWNNAIDDMIARTYDARGVGKSQNIASARISGLEFDSRFVLHNKAAIALKYTLQKPENQSSNAAFKNKLLPGRAEQSLFSRVDVPFGPWLLRYEANARYKLYYDTANLLKAKNRLLHNIRLSRDFTKQFNAAFELNNITNQQHEDFNGYPKPGRAAFLTLNYTFKPSETP